MKIDTLQTLQAYLARKTPCAVVTALDGGGQALVDAEVSRGDLSLSAAQLVDVRDRIIRDRSGMLEDSRLFVRVYGPPPRMIIIGAAHIALALVPMARLAAFDVTVIDPREGFARSSKFSDVFPIEAWPDEAMPKLELDVRTAVIALAHDPKLDDPALIAALRSPAFYIGALGSQRSHAKRLERLAGEGFGPEDLTRIRGPVGLDISAITSAEIAVSILAEVISVLRAGARRR